VKIAKAMGTLFTFSDPRDGGSQEWVQCHIRDTIALYKLIIDKALVEQSTVENGVYFAENGSFDWASLYIRFLKTLGLPERLDSPTPSDLEEMAKILSVRPDEVAPQISGR
jgi:hypothetical protein